MAAQRWALEESQRGEPLKVREEEGVVQDRRRKMEGPIWKGVAQSRPKSGEECMEEQVDMRGGEMVRVEVG